MASGTREIRYRVVLDASGAVQVIGKLRRDLQEAMQAPGTARVMATSRRVTMPITASATGGRLQQQAYAIESVRQRMAAVGPAFLSARERRLYGLAAPGTMLGQQMTRWSAGYQKGQAFMDYAERGRPGASGFTLAAGAAVIAHEKALRQWEERKKAVMHLERGNIVLNKLQTTAYKQVGTAVGDVGLSMKAFGQSMQQAMRQRQAFGAGFGRSMGEVGTGVARASHSMEKFAQAMRNGMAYAAPFRGSLNGMYVAMSAFEQTTGRAMQYLGMFAVALGTGALVKATKGIVDFTAMMEQVKLGAAETMTVTTRFFDLLGRPLPDQSQVAIALTEAGGAMKDMLDTAIQLGLPLEGIAEGFMTIAGAARSAGVSTKGAIEIVSLLGVLGERLHISSATLAREARDIFQALPQISRTVLGNYLQLDQAILKSQIASGNLEQFLLDRLKLVGLVAQQNRNTLMGLFHSVQGQLQRLGMEIGTGLTQQLMGLLHDVERGIEAIRKDPQKMQALADSFTQIGRALRTIAEWLTKIASAGPMRVLSLLTGVAVGGAVGRVAGRTASQAIGATVGGIIEGGAASMTFRELGGVARARTAASGLTGAAGFLATRGAVGAATGAAGIIGGTVTGVGVALAAGLAVDYLVTKVLEAYREGGETAADAQKKALEEGARKFEEATARGYAGQISFWEEQQRALQVNIAETALRSTRERFVPGGILGGTFQGPRTAAEQASALATLVNQMAAVAKQYGPEVFKPETPGGRLMREVTGGLPIETSKQLDIVLNALAQWRAAVEKSADVSDKQYLPAMDRVTQAFQVLNGTILTVKATFSDLTDLLKATAQLQAENIRDEATLTLRRYAKQPTQENLALAIQAHGPLTFQATEQARTTLEEAQALQNTLQSTQPGLVEAQQTAATAVAHGMRISWETFQERIAEIQERSAKRSATAGKKAATKAEQEAAAEFRSLLDTQETARKRLALEQRKEELAAEGTLGIYRLQNEAQQSIVTSAHEQNRLAAELEARERGILVLREQQLASERVMLEAQKERLQAELDAGRIKEEDHQRRARDQIEQAANRILAIDDEHLANQNRINESLEKQRLILLGLQNEYINLKPTVVNAFADILGGANVNQTIERASREMGRSMIEGILEEKLTLDLRLKKNFLQDLPALLTKSGDLLGRIPVLGQAAGAIGGGVSNVVGAIGGLLGGGSTASGALAGINTGGVGTFGEGVNFTAGYGGQSSLISGTSAFGGASALGGAGGIGGAAGGAAAGGYITAIVIAAIGAISKATSTRKRRQWEYNLSGREMAAAMQGAAVSGSFEALGLGALGEPLGKSMERNPVLAKTFLSMVAPGFWQLLRKIIQPKTTGAIAKKALEELIKEAGLPQQGIISGGGRGGIRTKFLESAPTSGAQAQLQALGFPSTYMDERVRNAQAIRAGTQPGVEAIRTGGALGLGVILGQEGGLQAMVDMANALTNNLEAMGVSAEEARRQLGVLASTAGIDLVKGIQEVNLLLHQQVLTTQNARAAVQGLIDVVGELPLAIDRATIAMAGWTGSTFDIGRIQRTIEDAMAVVGTGIATALTQAIQTADPAEGARSLADTFSTMFVNRLSERLIQQEAIGGALTEAARLAGLAAERLAAGDVTGFRQFAGQARTAFLQGQSVALKTFGTIVPEANTFLSSIGTFPSGTGIINPSGIGLPSLATTSMTQVPGPLGKPTLAIVHGGETVTAPGGGEVVQAIRQLAQVLAGQRQEIAVNVDGERLVRIIAKRADRVGPISPGPRAQIGVS